MSGLGGGGGVPGVGAWAAAGTALGLPGLGPAGPDLGLLGAGGEQAALRAAEAELRARREALQNPPRRASIVGLHRPARPEEPEEDDDEEVLEQEEELVGGDLEP